MGPLLNTKKFFRLGLTRTYFSSILNGARLYFGRIELWNNRFLEDVHDLENTHSPSSVAYRINVRL